MSTQRNVRLLSPEEYLAVEREAETKSEYLDGVITARASCNYQHVLIMGNILTEVSIQTRKRSGWVFSSDMRIEIPQGKAFFYPDISALLDEPILRDEHQDVLLNPTAIFEIISADTEAFDRGKKFHLYQQLPCLQEYLLVAPHKPVIEQYVRQTNGTWTYKAVIGQDSSLLLPSIECTLDLSAVYDKVDWKEYERSNSNDDE